MSIKNILFGATGKNLPKLPFDYVSYLLVGNGVNGTTTNIIDSSTNFLPTTIGGNTVISTTENKFGSGSVYFDGVGDYLTIGKSDSLVLPNNFTIEGWFYRTQQLGPYDALFTTRAAVSWSLGGSADTLVLNASGFHGLGSGYTAFSPSYTVPLNTWTHIAVVRNSNSIIFYFNGDAKHYIESYTNPVGNLNYSWGVGLFDSEGGAPRLFFKGYVYDFRITKGITQYLSNPTTVPTAPLPTSY